MEDSKCGARMVYILHACTQVCINAVECTCTCLVYVHVCTCAWMYTLQGECEVMMTCESPVFFPIKTYENQGWGSWKRHFVLVYKRTVMVLDTISVAFRKNLVV